MHKLIYLKNCVTIFVFVMLIFMSFSDRVLAETYQSNQETGYSVMIEDTAVLLTQEQISELSQQMFEITRYCNVAFVTTQEHEFESTKAFADDKGYELFGDQNAVLFVIDMKCREIYILSIADAFDKITTEKAYIITDNVYRFATSEEYYRCADVAFNQIFDTLGGKPVPAPMKYISNFFIAAIIAAIINYLLVIVIYRKNNSSPKKKKNGISFLFQMDEKEEREISKEPYVRKQRNVNDSLRDSFNPVLTAEQKKQIFDQKCRSVFENGENKYSDNPFAGIEDYYGEDTGSDYGDDFLGGLFEFFEDSDSSGSRYRSHSSRRSSYSSHRSSYRSGGSRSSYSSSRSGSRSSSRSGGSRSGGGGHRF